MTSKKCILITLFGIALLWAADILLPVMGITGFVIMVVGLLHLVYSILRRKDKRKALGILSTGILLFAFAWEYTEAPMGEADHLESVEIFDAQ